MSYRDLVAEYREKYIGMKVLYKGQPHTIVDVDYNLGLLIDLKNKFNATTAIYQFDKDLVLDYTPVKRSDGMVTEKKKASNAKFDATNTKQIKLKLNIRTDADILEKLDRTENVQGYIKKLIREDMKREGD